MESTPRPFDSGAPHPLLRRNTAAPTLRRHRSTLRAYRVILGSRLRSQRVYRTSFLLEVLSSMLFGLIEFAEVWLVFHTVRSLGGLTFEQVLLVFGLSNVSYSTSQVLVGHIDSIPTFLRLGTFDTFCLRPLSLLGQLVTSDVQLRRLGWCAVAVLSLAWALVVGDVAWSPTTLLLLVTTLVSGVAIFCGVFTWAAALQFFLVDGAEVTNAFTYGGRYAAQQPTAILPRPLLVTFVAAVPVAFTGYLPALALLDLPAPAAAPWLTPDLAWASPLVALWVWGVALVLWRFGTSHYQGGGG